MGKETSENQNKQNNNNRKTIFWLDKTFASTNGTENDTNNNMDDSVGVKREA